MRSMMMETAVTSKTAPRRNAGFSLVELIISVSIMVMMTGAITPALMRYVEKGRERRDTQSIEMLYSALGGALYDEVAYDAVKSGLEKKGIYSAPIAASALFLQDDAFADAVRDYIPTAPELTSASAQGRGASYEIMLYITETIDPETGIRAIKCAVWAGDADHCAGSEYISGILPAFVTVDS